MRKQERTKTDLALLALRVTAGGLLAGHGAQKLLGWFGGNGLEGTAGWLESMGLRPGKPWAVAAGLSEFSGGVLTALGLMNPVGPLSAIGAMTMATAKVHWGKPIWNASGGAELPLINSAIATTLDHALGVKLPKWLIAPGAFAALALGAFGVRTNPEQSETEQKEIEAEQAA